MKVLVIAPQPFFQERGTPIAVRLAVEALSRQLPRIDGKDSTIDLLVYNEGQDINIPGVTIIRGKIPRWLRGVRPGISCRKLLCDVFLFIQALLLLRRSRKDKDQYDVIHAVEEAVFLAWFAKKMFGIPYVYDMDSSLALQVTERWWWCKPALVLLQYLERAAVRGSIAVAPVCDALQAIAEQHGSSTTVLLRDVSLLPRESTTIDVHDRSTLLDPSITPEDIIILYVGNLESYQGIDLLIESFSLVRVQHKKARLVIVGGTHRHIDTYRGKARALGCESSVMFLGPRPLSALPQLLTSADIVVSPRIKGNNTPMKVYSYLHSGTPLVATDLPTHRQALDESIAVLAAPEPQAFANGLSRLISDPTLRIAIGKRARSAAEQLYTPDAFERQIGTLYTAVSHQIGDHTGETATMCENV